MRRPTSQQCTQPRHPSPIVHMPPPSRHSRPPSSAVSMFSSSQVFADATTLPNRNLLPRKISITKKRNSASEGAIDHDDEMIKTSNKSSPAEGGAEEESDISTCMNALTFNPTLPLEEDEEFYLPAADDQAKLMQWHYCLGHLSFPKLKLLAKNGEIPCRLAKIPPPKCAGCLFSTMTKLLWRSKESKSSHEVFTATKPGECVSVKHMISTQVRFFAQLKGKLISNSGTVMYPSLSTISPAFNTSI
jgi:hypothetical protein